ncbi:uncharacterized protein LOC143499442 isoform X2 [Brachyhypopomus gauderio]|uniref:uncharacterized protein LOC143499442 isoform X2 n=1 Tax=Brachyhypopomus gauderio TaxID=698409 RepID=UPI0040412D02
MTGIQTRDSVGDGSDDEPLSKFIKRTPTPERTHYSEDTTPAVDGTGGGTKKLSSTSPDSDFAEDASVKELPKECASAAESPGHSSDSEPLSTLLKSKGLVPGIAQGKQKTCETHVVKESSGSEDDQPLMTLIKKKKTEQEESAALDAKTPKRRKMTARASKLRQSSQVKTTQKRGRKGKAEAKRMAPAPSTAENQKLKRRGRPKKAETQAKAPSSDTSDDEPLSLLVRKKSQPEIKKAVVLLKRMSKSDVMDVIAQGRARIREQTGTASAGGAVESSDEEPLSHNVKRLKHQGKPARGSPGADNSSDDEPLVKQVKTAQGKNKCRERTNGEEDTCEQESKMGEELKEDLDDQCLDEKTSDNVPPSPVRESSNS